MPTSRVIWQGNPGEVHTNDTHRFQYQMVCDLVHTCGVCLQYHLAISNWWPIPFHRNCRCSQRPVPPGKSARPFESFRRILEGLEPHQQTEAIGKSNYRLLEAGAVKWDDIVTPTRVRSLKEVVAARKLSIPAMERAGVRPDLARNAFAAVHTPEQVLIRQERKVLVENLERAGLSKQQIVEAAARGIHKNVGIGAGPSKAQAIPETRRPSSLPAGLRRALKAFGPGTPPAAAAVVAVAPMATPAPVPAPAYALDVHGNMSASDVAEFREAIEALPAPVLDAIRRAGGKFVVAEKLADWNPDLASQTPRGWPAGMTWANAEGLYDNGRKSVVACKTRVHVASGQPEVSSRRIGVLRHEAGHGFDAAIGKPSRHHPDWADAYNRDVAAIDPAKTGALGYYLQAGTAGREEAFAEIFAQLNGGGSDKHEDVLANFPECTRRLKEWMSKGATK